jgi:hypothetical protein
LVKSWFILGRFSFIEDCLIKGWLVGKAISLSARKTFALDLSVYAGCVIVVFSLWQTLCN